MITQAKLIASLLARAPDPVQAAAVLQTYLSEPSTANRERLGAVGLTPDAIDQFRDVLPTDHFELGTLCQLGAMWEAGRRSVPTSSTWSPVVTTGDDKPAEFERRTAETLISLIIQAKDQIRICVSFVDVAGVRALTHPLVEASKRGVTVVVGYRAAADKTGAFDDLRAELEAQGDGSLCLVVPLKEGDAFQHLKLVAVDGRRAYIGSANLTYAALTRNVEIGALVEGEQVRIYEQLFDRLIAESDTDGN